MLHLFPDKVQYKWGLLRTVQIMYFYYYTLTYRVFVKLSQSFNPQSDYKLSYMSQSVFTLNKKQFVNAKTSSQSISKWAMTRFQEMCWWHVGKPPSPISPTYWDTATTAPLRPPKHTHASALVATSPRSTAYSTDPKPACTLSLMWLKTLLQASFGVSIVSMGWKWLWY